MYRLLVVVALTLSMTHIQQGPAPDNDEDSDDQLERDPGEAVGIRRRRQSSLTDVGFYQYFSTFGNSIDTSPVYVA